MKNYQKILERIHKARNNVSSLNSLRNKILESEDLDSTKKDSLIKVIDNRKYLIINKDLGINE